MLVLVCLIYKGEIQTLPSPTFVALGSQEWGSADFQNCPRGSICPVVLQLGELPSSYL